MSTPQERAESIRAASMIRDHSFTGDGPYCEAMLSRGPVGDPATTGVVTMKVGCGYPADLHEEVQ